MLLHIDHRNWWHVYKLVKFTIGSQHNMYCTSCNVHTQTFQLAVIAHTRKPVTFLYCITFNLFTSRMPMSLNETGPYRIYMKTLPYESCSKQLSWLHTTMIMSLHLQWHHWNWSSPDSWRSYPEVHCCCRRNNLEEMCHYYEDQQLPTPWSSELSCPQVLQWNTKLWFI